ncbi:DUF1700 domain-containing protein [Kineothrix sp. MB12-C1]|uniref:DUF1700 domain-containing protein n=1 Tax=Kineothrix sp. MB12-C1 TaxID=3070215 RepID=UPI0027D1F66E|nr:DUF1700 domain-containing protein [Kineothrix sp. MB12-C1]WMC94087.1 DUF1700 domain-containing protein [Kineothrix sp. MB12-C1]
MNKADYMQSLKKQLRRLPREDFEKAIEYFEEYFSDAGIENEAQVIEDLGTPEFAAEQIITNIALKNTNAPVKDVKKGLNAVWVGVLAVCAAPIALPFALALVIVIVTFVFCILMVIACFIFSGIVFTLMGPICIAAGFTAITTNIPVFISCIGTGFVLMGIGMLLTFSMVRLCQRFLTAIVRFFGRLIRKGERKNEQNK